MTYRLLLPALLLFLFCSCGFSPSQPAEEESISANIQAPPVAIQVVPARQGAFAMRIFGSGVLKAAERAPIHVQIGGLIEQLPVQEGAFIPRGGLIVALEDKALQLRLAQTRVTLDEATIEKKDLLLLQRGRPDDDQSVPPERLAAILTRSGFTRASLALQQAELELAQCKVYAPFGGVVGSLKVKPYQQVNAGAEICTLINPNTFEAEFNLLEREALQVSPGQSVRVQPVAAAAQEYNGVISTINPVVNEQGLVLVRARLKAGAKSRLLEGMNVQVIIEKKIPNQIIVPKSAVVLRSARPVVFTFSEKENLAKWNYVVIAYENDVEVAISEGIQPGDQVIVEGNLNLDHDALVKVDRGNRKE